jgi:uncharacterized protein
MVYKSLSGTDVRALNKGRFLFLFFLLLCSASYAQVTEEPVDAAPFDTVIPNGLNVFHFENGIISSTGYMKDGKPEGVWKNYYENGKLKSTGKRTSGMLDSTWVFYNDKGFPALEFNYREGKRDGVQKTFYDSAKVRSVEVFVADKRQGMAKYYKQNGLLSREVPFEEGVESGIAKEYDDEGTVILISTYKNGFLVKDQEINRKDFRGLRQGPWKHFYENSQQIQWEGIFKNNLKNGTFRDFDSTGKLVRTQEFINGELVDFSTLNNKGERVRMEIRREYYPNAQDKIVGSYKNGVPEGVFREYSMDGEVIDTKVYKEGKVTSQGILDDSGLEQGHWKFFYYPKGKIRSEGDYKDGKKTGLWKYYHENGNLMQEGSYVEDKAEGTWKWYYENGKSLREETYKNGKELGEAREFNDSTAKVITEGGYVDGQKDGYWQYEIGDMKVGGKYFEGKEDGVWKEYYRDGKLSFEGSYIKGDANGTHRFYYPEGTLQEERNYRLGLKNGKWRYFDREGNLITTIEYKDDREIKIDGVKLEAEKRKRKRAGKK